MHTEKALVVLSGGQDSTTCLFWAKSMFKEVHAVTYNYGQRHAIEIEAAKKVAELAGISDRHCIVDVGNILQGSSPLVSKETLEQYPDFNSLPGGLEKTFVPGRNMLFATLAANHAYARGIDRIVMGVCQEDFGGYPDCRLVFINAVEASVRTGFALSTEDPFYYFSIFTPLMHLSKAASVQLAINLENGCYEALAYSHTSYDGQYPPVWHDHATLLRAKGFFEAGVPDPLIVRAVKEGLMQYPETPNYAEVRNAQ